MTVRPVHAAILVAVLLVTAGCGGGPHEHLVGRWSDASGRALPDGTEAENSILVVNTFLASDHCDGRKNTVYLELSWPIGTRLDRNDPSTSMENSRFYVRGHSVENLVASEPYDDDVVLPASAVPTGYVREGNAISVDEVGPAYVTRPNGRTERWPQIALSCA